MKRPGRPRPRAEDGAASAAADRIALCDRVLMAALPHVAALGWSAEAAAAGAADAGLGAAAGARVFPGGGIEMAGHFADWADRRMLVAVPNEALAGLKVRQKIAALARARLHAMAPHREAVRRLAGLALLPPSGADGLTRLWRTADRIWYAAGDTATDWNHYTKRAILSGVLLATTLHWLADETEGFAATDAFLDRRIEDAMRIGRFKLPGLDAARAGAAGAAAMRLAGRLVGFAGRVVGGRAG